MKNKFLRFDVTSTVNVMRFVASIASVADFMAVAKEFNKGRVLMDRMVYELQRGAGEVLMGNCGLTQ